MPRMLRAAGGCALARNAAAVLALALAPALAAASVADAQRFVVRVQREEAAGGGRLEEVHHGDGSRSFRSTSGTYFSALPDGSLAAAADDVRAFEKFNVRELQDGTVALQTFHGDYVAARQDGSIGASRSHADVEAHFTRVANQDGTVSLKSVDGRLLQVVPKKALRKAAPPRAMQVSTPKPIVEMLEANPPTWPSTVHVFSPEDDVETINQTVFNAYERTGGRKPYSNNGQFTGHRYAFLFKPGRYNVEVPVGYYTQVAGLGDSPEDVVFTSEKGVYCEEGSFNFTMGALNTFWRSAENFRTSATFSWFAGLGGMLWSVSQASPLRRVIVDENLLLYQYHGGDLAGYASGGFMANTKVTGTVYSGSQQQFLARNCQVGMWAGGVFNMVFVGTVGAPAYHCGGATIGSMTPAIPPYVTVGTTPVIAEKPYVTIDDEGKYYLNIPEAVSSTQGTDFSPKREKVGFEHVFVADAARHSAAMINDKLDRGLHVVLAPGVYKLDQPLRIEKPGQVLLGLGLATLQADNGTSAIVVGDVDGVRIAGVLIEAGPLPTETLLEWGTPGSTFKGSAQRPGTLHDVFVRVGGRSTPQEWKKAQIMIRLNSGHVIGDNLWLWRADHEGSGHDGGEIQVEGGANPCDNGLVVNGDDVTVYGLAAEHSLKDQVVWNGNRGATYFFQAELPYDVTQSFGDAGYTGYRVGDGVEEHTAYGVGIYHFFRDHEVVVESGIVAPQHLEGSFHSPLSLYLNGKGVMRHILNAVGGETSKDLAVPTAIEGARLAMVAWHCPASEALAPLLPPLPPLVLPVPPAVLPDATPSAPAMPKLKACGITTCLEDWVCCFGLCGMPGSQCCGDASKNQLCYSNEWKCCSGQCMAPGLDCYPESLFTI